MYDQKQQRPQQQQSSLLRLASTTTSQAVGTLSGANNRPNAVRAGPADPSPGTSLVSFARRLRLINLAGSVAFGLAVTNAIWLWFIFDNRNYENDSLVTTTAVYHVRLTQGMVILWTVGGGLHALFDNAVWYLSACNCCHALPFGESVDLAERYEKYGNYVVLCVMVVCTAAATFAVFLRAALEAGSAQQSTSTASADAAGVKVPMDAAAYGFLIGYAVELGLAYLVYYPLIYTMLFSGVLGCLGIGRPSELRQEERLLRKEPSSQTAPSSRT